MAKTNKIKIPAMPDGSHRQAGSYDKAARWYPDSKFCVPGSFQVRSPSRSWPYSYLKHFYSAKYSALLFEANPRLWLKIQGIDLASEKGAVFIAAHTARRITR